MLDVVANVCSAESSVVGPPPPRVDVVPQLADTIAISIPRTVTCVLRTTTSSKFSCMASRNREPRSPLRVVGPRLTASSSDLRHSDTSHPIELWNL